MRRKRPRVGDFIRVTRVEPWDETLGVRVGDVAEVVVVDADPDCPGVVARCASWRHLRAPSDVCWIADGRYELIPPPATPAPLRSASPVFYGTEVITWN